MRETNNSGCVKKSAVRTEERVTGSRLLHHPPVRLRMPLFSRLDPSFFTAIIPSLGKTKNCLHAPVPRYPITRMTQAAVHI